MQSVWGRSALAGHRIQRWSRHVAITSMSSGSFQFDELAAHILPLQHHRYLLAHASCPANLRRSPLYLPLPSASLPAPARDPDHSRPLPILLLPVIMPLPLLLFSRLSSSSSCLSSCPYSFRKYLYFGFNFVFYFVLNFVVYSVSHLSLSLIRCPFPCCF